MKIFIGKCIYNSGVFLNGLIVYTVFRFANYVQMLDKFAIVLLHCMHYSYATVPCIKIFLDSLVRFKIPSVVRILQIDGSRNWISKLL